MLQFKSFDELKKAVDEDKLVYWKNSDYRVMHAENMYLILYRPTGISKLLFDDEENTKSNYEIQEFYMQ